MKGAYKYLDDISIYSRCADACEHCAAACLVEKDAARFRCIELCRDCADLCRQTVTFMLRDSDYVNICMQLCRIACLACAEECATHNSEHCQACARSCRVCAEEVLIDDPGNEDPGSQIEAQSSPGTSA